MESQPYNAACVVQLSVFHYVCMYVCMYVTVRFFHQDSNKPSFRYVTVEQMFQTGRELIHRAMLHVWHSCQSQACWNAVSSKEV